MAAQAPPQVVVGTAGHIDHGKTALVEALTGTNADRLPEERARGMSIELGFAFCPGARYQQPLDLAFIDCPGHARFVRQAIAGMGAMDGCLLIVAANEGVSAQTREHLELLGLFALRWGRVVITKADLVDAGRLAALGAELRSLCTGSPLGSTMPIVVSAHDGSGIDELRAWLFQRAAEAIPARAELLDDPPRLAVDRCFTVQGHGTVVTGTLQQGRLRVGDRIGCHPGPVTQIRGLQVRGLAVDQAEAGQRTAINLARVEVGEVARGSWLAPEDDLQATAAIDVRLTPLGPGLRHAQTLLVHHGTRQVGARLSLYDVDHATEGLAIGQLRLDEPCYLGVGSRLILRRASPAGNLGAAEVVAVDAPRRKRFRPETAAYFKAMAGPAGTRLSSWLEQRYPVPADRQEARRWAGGERRLAVAIEEAGLAVVERVSGSRSYLWSAAGWRRLRAALLDELGARQGATLWQPIAQLKQAVAGGCPDAPWDDHVADAVTRGELARDRSLVCAPSSVPPLVGAVATAAAELLARYREAGPSAGYNRPMVEAAPDVASAGRALVACAERGWLIRLSDRQHVHRATMQAILDAMAEAFAAGEVVDFQWFKQRFAISRRYALPIAEWFDAVEVTCREGSERRPGRAWDQRAPRLPVPRFGEALA